MRQTLRRGSGGGMYARKTHATREAPRRGQGWPTDAREGQAGRPGVAERFAVPLKPGNAGGGKGPQFKTDAISGEGFGDGQTINSEICPETAEALHAKAKAEAGYRFYALYDKISSEDILAHALCPVPLQQGRAGRGWTGLRGHRRVWGCSGGSANWRLRSGKRLTDRTHQKSVHTKANGKLRPLGISTLRDRVCMTAAMLVLETIFEADLPPEQYAYRPGRNAQQVWSRLDRLLYRGHPEVVDADLADYFGEHPPCRTIEVGRARIVDRRVLHLIKMWLECAVEGNDDRGRKTRTSEARDKRRGIPQGSPISPLLANLYMRRFVLGWKMLGLERSLGTRLVTYADDLVILCKKGKADEALQQLRKIMSKLKLTVNEEKTRICKVPEGEFDFLGYTFGQMHSARTPGAPGISAIEEEHQTHG